MININKKIIDEIKILSNNSHLSKLVANTKDINDLKDIKKDINIFINLGLINNIIRINKFHELVNQKLHFESYYVISSETLEERRKRVWTKTSFGFKNIVRIIDFIYKRVFPKLPLIKKIYFLITKGHNRVISKAEILGRLISCGFNILKYLNMKIFST